MNEPTAFLRVNIGADGRAQLTVVISLNGAEVEALVDGFVGCNLIGAPVASYLDVRFQPQHVEFLTNAGQEATEEGASSQEPSEAGSYQN